MTDDEIHVIAYHVEEAEPQTIDGIAQWPKLAQFYAGLEEKDITIMHVTRTATGWAVLAEHYPELD